MDLHYFSNFESIDRHTAPKVGISQENNQVTFTCSYNKDTGVQLSTILAFCKMYLENFNENLNPKNQEDINTIAAINEAIMWVNKKHGYNVPIGENHHA